MNIGTFAGRVGQDAELRYTTSGKAVASFSLAIDQGKDGNGQPRKPLWIKAVLWEKKAEALAQYIAKGNVAVVSGPVSLENWTNQQGEAKSQIVVTVREFTFGGGGNKSEAQQSAQPAQPPFDAPSAPISDEDIPF